MRAGAFVAVAAVVDAVVVVVVLMAFVVVVIAVWFFLLMLLILLLLFNALFLLEWLPLSGAGMMAFLTMWVGLLLTELAAGTPSASDDDDSGTGRRGSWWWFCDEGGFRKWRGSSAGCTGFCGGGGGYGLRVEHEVVEWVVLIVRGSVKHEHSRRGKTHQSNDVVVGITPFGGSAVVVAVAGEKEVCDGQ